MKQLRVCTKLIIMTNVVKQNSIITKLTHKHRISFVMIVILINVANHTTKTLKTAKNTT